MIDGSPTQVRYKWLRKQKGIKVFNPERNDGIYAFRYYVSFTGKWKVGLVKFYEQDGELFWQQTPHTNKKTGKKTRKYDMVSIEPESVTLLADKLYELMGEETKTKEERIKDIGEKGILTDLADKYGG